MSRSRSELEAQALTPWALWLESAGGRARVIGDREGSVARDLAHWGFELESEEQAQVELLVILEPPTDARQLEQQLARAHEVAWIVSDSEQARVARKHLGAKLATCELILWPSAWPADELFSAARGGLRPSPEARRKRVPLATLRRFGLQSLCGSSRALLTAASAPRFERALTQLAEATGEAPQTVEHFFAACGGTLEAHTRDSRSSLGWTLTLAARPEHAPAIERGHAVQQAAARHGALVPEPLAFGNYEGISMACERRVNGRPADRARISASALAKVDAELPARLSKLAHVARERLASEELERYIASWQSTAAPLLAHPQTNSILTRLTDQARERLEGVELPRVISHGDLRPRHVLVDTGGAIQGLIHWTLGDERGLPALDLVHYFLHAKGAPLGELAARLLRAEEAPVGAAQHLQRYGEMLGIERRALWGLARLELLALAAVAGAYSAERDPAWFAELLAPLSK